MKWLKRCKDAGCQKSITGKCSGCGELRSQIHPETEMCLVCSHGEPEQNRYESFVAHTQDCVRLGQ